MDGGGDDAEVTSDGWGAGEAACAASKWQRDTWMGMAASETLRIGWASRDITPEKPCELAGQYYRRLSTGVRDPLQVTAWALESRPGQAVFVTIDVVGVPLTIIDRIRERVRQSAPDLDTSRIIVSVTHTHSAPPITRVKSWFAPSEGVLSVEDYAATVVQQAADAIIEAWRNRRAGFIGTAFTAARIGHCRRAVYADGHAEMYGSTRRGDFRQMEAGEDSGIEMLFCWDDERRLTGIVLNVACPSQVMEATYVVSADFAGEARRQLRDRFGEHVFVLPQISAAGEQSPRDLVRGYRGAEPDMWHEDGAVELGQRIASAVAAVHATAEAAMSDHLPLEHRVEAISLPLWRVSTEEHAEAQHYLASMGADSSSAADDPDRDAHEHYLADCRAAEAAGGPGPYDSKEHHFVRLVVARAVIERFRTQDERPAVDIELHAVRLGDSAFVTNPFELFLDYGQRIKAGSRASQTFLVQLACGSLGYLPTAAAVARGGYGATVANGIVGPEGGDLLVNRSIEAIEALQATGPWRSC